MNLATLIGLLLTVPVWVSRWFPTFAVSTAAAGRIFIPDEYQFAKCRLERF